MVWQFMRGYGILILSSLGILAGFLLYRHYKQDVLAYSLDLIGDRLVAMAPDDGSKNAILAMYDSFKDRVLAQEVPPEQVEHVAENILNLGNNGATLTKEQAEAMLQLPMLATVALDSVGSTKKVLYIKPEQFEAIGRRIKSVYEFDVKIRDIIRKQRDARRETLMQRIHYECANGLRLVVDPRLDKELAQDEFKQLNPELQQLEQEKMVVWKENLAVERKRVQQQARRDMQSIAELKNIQDPTALKELERLKALKGLEAHDFHFNDTYIKEIVARALKQTEEVLRQQELMKDKDRS